MWSCCDVPCCSCNFNLAHFQALHDLSGGRVAAAVATQSSVSCDGLVMRAKGRARVLTLTEVVHDAAPAVLSQAQREMTAVHSCSPFLAASLLSAK